MTFTIVGERINTTLKNVKQAVEKRDAAYIQDDVKKQEAAGVTYIDVNAGARFGKELPDMEWLLDVIQEVVSVPLALDSPNPEVLEMALGKVKQRPLINSISLESDRFDRMMSFLKGKDCRITALCMDDTGMPSSVDDVFKRARRLVEELEGIGFAREDIFVDPLIQPVSVNTQNGKMALMAVQRIMTEIPGVHTIGGLSNVSFGMPQRKIINRNFLTLLMGQGFDAAILDPLDTALMAVLSTVEMLLGDDEYCLNYLSRVREGLIQA
jgi:5-methyltetrahydrofolate--homocysteine methyltransferase